ncbi:MAG TPA: hypothetical protein VHS59_06560 [Bacillota bacterium]|nr:hypothetical protein [Bacillota bacterium]
MDTNSAVQQIKKDLDTTFGATLASTLLSMARTKAKAPLIGMTKDDYLRLVDTLCTDKKVEQMLGASGVKEKQRKWKDLV